MRNHLCFQFTFLPLFAFDCFFLSIDRFPLMLKRFLPHNSTIIISLFICLSLCPFSALLFSFFPVRKSLKLLYLSLSLSRKSFCYHVSIFSSRAFDYRRRSFPFSFFYEFSFFLLTSNLDARIALGRR